MPATRKMPAKPPSGSKPRRESDTEYMRRKLESFNAKGESAKKEKDAAAALAEGKLSPSSDSPDAKRMSVEVEHLPMKEGRRESAKPTRRESSKRSRSSARRDSSRRESRRKDRVSALVDSLRRPAKRSPEGDEDHRKRSRSSARRDSSRRESSRKDRVSPLEIDSLRRSPRGPEGDEDHHSASTASESFSENGGKRRKGRNGVLVSPWMMLAMCMWYCVSLVAVALLGFWLHMRFVSTYEAGDGAAESGSPGFRKPSGDMQFQPLPPGYQLVATAPSSAPYDVIKGANGTGVLITTQSSDVGTQAPTSSSEPSGAPSIGPSLLPTTTGRPSVTPTTEPPSMVPSTVPSASPTGLPGCPDELSGSQKLDVYGLVNLRYEVVTYKGDMGGGVGGLLCVSLEYEGVASWIGLAFSEAKRNPKFGKKEAVIGIPGLATSTAMRRPGDGALHSGLGQMNDPLSPDEGQPVFFNPGKYNLPAGGTDGYSGPSLETVSPAGRQSLQNATVNVRDMSSTGIVTSEDLWRTTLSFGKYLREPGEIQIDPAALTLVLYAVSPADGGPDPADGNPDWTAKSIQFGPSLGGSSTTKSHLRKRIRKKEQDEEDPP